MQRLICPHCSQEIVLVVKKKAKPKEQKKPEEDKPMTIEQFQKWCELKEKRFLQIIGAWAGITKPTLATVKQWEVYISRNIRPAQPFSSAAVAGNLLIEQRIRVMETLIPTLSLLVIYLVMYLLWKR